MEGPTRKKIEQRRHQKRIKEESIKRQNRLKKIEDYKAILFV